MKRTLFLFCVLYVSKAIAQPHIWHGCALAPNGRDAWAVTIDTTLIYHSSNLGVTWEEQSILTQRVFFDVFFLDELNGWTAGIIADAWHTTDGGIEWYRQALGTSKFFSRMFFYDPTHGWAAAGAAVMGRWDEENLTWEQIILPYPPYSADTVDFYGIVFTDTLNGWACAGRYPEEETLFWGGQGYIVRSTDSGRNWDLVERDTVHDFFDVDFVDEQHGWVVGGSDWTMRGYVTRTTDGGLTWTARELPEAGMLRAVDFVDERHGWASGKFGTIIATSDGGESWQPQVSGADSTLFDIEFADTLVGMASGEDAVLFTTDGGRNWRRSEMSAVREQPLSRACGLALETRTGRRPSEFLVRGTLPANTVASLAVFDGQGRRVRTLFARRQTQGQFEVVWDGRNEQGQMVAAGTYFIRLASPGAAVSTRAAVIR